MIIGFILLVLIDEPNDFLLAKASFTSIVEGEDHFKSGSKTVRGCKSIVDGVDVGRFTSRHVQGKSINMSTLSQYDIVLPICNSVMFCVAHLSLLVLINHIRGYGS